jgi:hypothetical protein
MTPTQQGFLSGYINFKPDTVQVPVVPYSLNSWERAQWIEGWEVGRDLASHHSVEMGVVIDAMDGVHA